MTAQAKTTPTLFKIDPLKVFKRVLLKINYFRIFKHKFFKTKRFKILLAAAVGILGLLVVMVTALAGTTFIVNDTGDASDANAGDGICATATSVCTLRAAIEEANASSGSDTIKFNIGTGTKTISPGSQLPSITGPVTIDGTTQAATLGSLGIELKGSNAPSNANGLVIKGSDVTVRGLVINRFGNRGISIEGVGATNNKVEGNYVGTDATGTNDLGNSSYGVYVNSAPNNTIGGTASGARNVISGNNQIGIRVNGSSALEIQGNYIGTDATGTRDLGNFYGVMIESAPNNTIGGTTSGAGNVISGNDGYGVVISSSGSTGNQVQGNYIGTDATGTNDLGNSFSGVVAANASNNTIGGTTSGAGNVISGNDNPSGGVQIGFGSTGNKIQGNSIYDNTGLGIDLGGNGVTTNDANDGDGSPNNLQNYPLLNTALNSAGTTTISGRLNSTPSSAFTVQLFSNTAADPSGYGEGQTYLGQQDVTTDSSGNATLSFTTTQASSGQYVSATATNDTTNDTSEFSKDVVVNTPPVSNDQSVATDEDAAKKITLSGTDTDGNGLTFEITSGPTNGTLGSVGTPTCTGTAPKACSADVTYTPKKDFNGTDSFKFRVNDGTDNSDEATVNITRSTRSTTPR